MTEYNYITIPIGYRICPITGEKLPLTKEQEEWSQKVLEKSLADTEVKHD